MTAAVLDRFQLTGKTALVTGASRNIGLAITRELAGAGARVIMVARSEDRLEAAADEVRESVGGELVTVPGDVGDRADIERLTTRVLEDYGSMDVLVNNAHEFGDTNDTDPLDISEEVWRRTFEVNVLGPYRLCRAFGRVMRAGSGGSIVNLLSGAGLLPVPGVMPYGCTKAALWMMTRYLAVELAPKVRVNGLCPGNTREDSGLREVMPGDERRLAAIPAGRLGLPDEIAPAALYLASDASTYTTGSLLVVNGGRSW